MTMNIDNVLNASTAIEAAEKFSEYILKHFPHISEEDINQLQEDFERHPPHSKTLIFAKLLSGQNAALFAWSMQTFGTPDPDLSYSGCPMEVYIAQAGPAFILEATVQEFKFKSSPKAVGAWDLVVYWYSDKLTQETIEATIAFLKTQGKPANFADVAESNLSENDLKFFGGTRIPEEIYQQACDMFYLFKIALSGDAQTLHEAFSTLRLEHPKGLAITQEKVPSLVQNMLESIVLYSVRHEPKNALPFSALHSLGWVFSNNSLKSAQEKQRQKENAAKAAEQLGVVHRTPKPTAEGKSLNPAGAEVPQPPQP